MEISRHETYDIKFEDYNLEIRYYPSDHRAEIETEEIHPRNNPSEDELLQDRLGLEYEAENYGEPAYNFIEVFLQDESGLHIEDENQKMRQILEPRKPK